MFQLCTNEYDGVLELTGDLQILQLRSAETIIELNGGFSIHVEPPEGRMDKNDDNIALQWTYVYI